MGCYYEKITPTDLKWYSNPIDSRRKRAIKFSFYVYLQAGYCFFCRFNFREIMTLSQFRSQKLKKKKEVQAKRQKQISRVQAKRAARYHQVRVRRNEYEKTIINLKLFLVITK